jgi:hypothetical protein
LVFLFASLLICDPRLCSATVYKYKDANGVWHFSDTPPPDYQGEIEADQSAGSGQSDLSGLPDLEARLVKQLNPRSAIERATLATLAVQSPIGFGSGFFISDSGHILTNKHVIRTTEDDEKRKTLQYEKTEAKIREIQEQIRGEERRLEKFKNDLTDFKAFIERQPASEARRLNQQRYDTNLAQYRSWQKDFGQRKKSFQKEKDRILKEQSKARLNDSLAYLNRSFSVYTADNVKHYAYLVAVSKRMDLALLKLDGYRTPVLKVAPRRSLIAGKAVYAIGNPVRLRNSVTSGILSGIEGRFAKTNAQIYPGNSGGPLVTPDGQVIGVNTFKRLTHKFEGLGFAILIEKALEEFSGHLE